MLLEFSLELLRLEFFGMKFLGRRLVRLGRVFELFAKFERERFHAVCKIPSETLQIAQKLYLNGLISYPRTSSQKIPDAIEPKKILKLLEANFPEAAIATRAKPIEGKKE